MAEDPRYQPSAVTLTDQEAARRLLRATDAQRGFRLDAITRQELEMLARGRRPSLAFDEDAGPSMPFSALGRAPQARAEGVTLSQLVAGAPPALEPLERPLKRPPEVSPMQEAARPAPPALEPLERPMARPPVQPPAPPPTMPPPPPVDRTGPFMHYDPSQIPLRTAAPAGPPSPPPVLEPPERPMARPPMAAPLPPSPPPPVDRTGPFMHYDPSQIPLRTQDPGQPGLMSYDPTKLLLHYRPPPVPPRPGELPDLPEAGFWSRAGRTGGEAGKEIAATGIDILGGTGGYALGASTRIPGAAVVGEMVGSLAANKLNKALNLREGGPPIVAGMDVGDVVATAVPPLARAVRPIPATKAVVRNLPGARPEMHEQAAEQITNWVGSVTPDEPAEAIFARIRQGTNPAIPATNLWRTAGEVVREQTALVPAARNARLLRLAQGLLRLGRQHGGQIPLDQLDNHREAVGGLLRAARRGDGRNDAEYSRLYAAFHRDYERAAARNIPEAQELQAGLQASRREHAQEEFQRFFAEGSPGLSRRPDGQVEVHGGKLRTRFDKRMREDQVLRESLTQAEQEEIRQIFTQAETLPRLRPVAGAQYGSGRGVLASTVGAGLSQALGAPLAIGSGLVMGVPALMSWGLTTPRGRQIVRWAFRQGHQLMSPEMLALLRSGMQQELGLSPVPTPRETGQAAGEAGTAALPDLPDLP